MRIAFVGDFVSTGSTEICIANALEAIGEIVFRLQERKYSVFALTDSIKSCKADVLLFSKCRIDSMYHCADVLSTVRRQTGVKTVCWFFDLIRKGYGSRWRDWALRVAHQCDLFFITDSDSGIPDARLLRQAYGGPTTVGYGSACKHYPKDVAHLGWAYGKRKDWLTEMQRAFPGFQEIGGCYNSSLFDLMKSTRIIVGPPWPSYPGYWSNRIYIVAGHGGCFACPRVEGMDEDGWVPGENYINLSADTPSAVEELKYVWLTMHDKELQRIRNNAQKLVFERHTYKHRVTELVKQMQEL